MHVLSCAFQLFFFGLYFLYIPIGFLFSSDIHLHLNIPFPSVIIPKHVNSLTLSTLYHLASVPYAGFCPCVSPIVWIPFVVSLTLLTFELILLLSYYYKSNTWMHIVLRKYFNFYIIILRHVLLFPGSSLWDKSLLESYCRVPFPYSKVC